MKRKLFSIIAVLVMMLGLIPATALAAPAPQEGLGGGGGRPGMPADYQIPLPCVHGRAITKPYDPADRQLRQFYLQPRSIYGGSGRVRRRSPER